MKKIIAMLLVLTMALALVACGGSGDNWKNFLSDGTNDGYVEIQAGLACTQLEHVPLAAKSVYSWVEAYGALDEDAQKLHGDWQTARETVVKAIDEAFAHRTDAVLEQMADLSATPGVMIQNGSGWGGLEQLRRSADAEEALSEWYDFPESTLTGSEEILRSVPN